MEKEYEMTVKVKGYKSVTKTVKKLGNGAMVIVPKSWLGKKAKVILLEDYE